MAETPGLPAARERTDLEALWALPPRTVVTVYDAQRHSHSGPLVRVEPEAIVLRVAGNARAIPRSTVVSFIEHAASPARLSSAAPMTVTRTRGGEPRPEVVHVAVRAGRALRNLVNPRVTPLTALGALVGLLTDVVSLAMMTGDGEIGLRTALAEVDVLFIGVAVVMLAWWRASPARRRPAVGQFVHGFLFMAVFLALVVGPCVTS